MKIVKAVTQLWWHCNCTHWCALYNEQLVATRAKLCQKWLQLTNYLSSSQNIWQWVRHKKELVRCKPLCHVRIINWAPSLKSQYVSGEARQSCGVGKCVLKWDAHLGELSALALRPVHRQHQERVEHDEQHQRQEDEHQAGEPVEHGAVRVQLSQLGQFHHHAGRLQQIRFCWEWNSKEAEK